MASLGWISSRWSVNCETREHRSILEIHQRLIQQGVGIAQRTVTDLLERYEELVALHLADEERVQQRLR